MNSQFLPKELIGVGLNGQKWSVFPESAIKVGILTIFELHFDEIPEKQKGFSLLFPKQWTECHEISCGDALDVSAEDSISKQKLYLSP